MIRKFEDSPAVREKVPLITGLFGPSGSGKTYSALRLAKGMQRITGGDIFGIDTEAGRMKHYADVFKFRHLNLTAPFGSLDYLAAIRHCANKGAGIIIVDSMTHEHEGEGGFLKTHEAEIRKMVEAPGSKWNDFSASIPAWGVPKRNRRDFIDGVLQVPAINFIFCFRAKEKIKIKKGQPPVQQGWMPIAGEEFLFEMALCALLLPGCQGVPTWESTDPGTRQMIKLPQQFRQMMRMHGTGEGDTFKPASLNEAIGEKLSKWAAGAAAGSPEYFRLFGIINDATNKEMLDAAGLLVKEAVEAKKLDEDERRYLRGAFDHRLDFIKKPTTINVDTTAADENAVTETAEKPVVVETDELPALLLAADEANVDMLDFLGSNDYDDVAAILALTGADRKKAAMRLTKAIEIAKGKGGK